MLNSSKASEYLVGVRGSVSVWPHCSEYVGNSMPQSKSGKAKKSSAVTSQKAEDPKICFIELGSVKCIPCRQMQPVMKNIEAKYLPRAKVISYDV